MASRTGLRERKKLVQRQRIADVAAELFAEHGYDDVSMADVAQACDVSYQTVYNYFPAKQDLGLDRAAELRALYASAVRDRRGGTSPADALWPLIEADIDRYQRADPGTARGQHPALCVGSTVFRGFALLAREQDVLAIADAITTTTPAVAPLLVRVHAAALVAILQAVTDRIGASILSGTASAETADEMRADAQAAIETLGHQFESMAPPVGLRRADRHGPPHPINSRKEDS